MNLLFDRDLVTLRKNKGGLMFISKLLGFILLTTVSLSSFADKGKYFDRAIIVIFENTNYSNAIKQPFFKKIADQGALFSNFLALAFSAEATI